MPSAPAEVPVLTIFWVGTMIRRLRVEINSKNPDVVPCNGVSPSQSGGTDQFGSDGVIWALPGSGVNWAFPPSSPPVRPAPVYGGVPESLPPFELSFNGNRYYWEGGTLFKIVNNVRVRVTDPAEVAAFGRHWSSVYPQGKYNASTGMWDHPGLSSIPGINLSPGNYASGAANAPASNFSLNVGSPSTWLVVGGVFFFVLLIARR